MEEVEDSLQITRVLLLTLGIIRAFLSNYLDKDFEILLSDQFTIKLKGKTNRQNDRRCV